jgi:hypothetical protein
MMILITGKTNVKHFLKILSEGDLTGQEGLRPGDPEKIADRLYYGGKSSGE